MSFFNTNWLVKEKAESCLMRQAKISLPQEIGIGYPLSGMMAIFKIYLVEVLVWQN